MSNQTSTIQNPTIHIIITYNSQTSLRPTSTLMALYRRLCLKSSATCPNTSAKWLNTSDKNYPEAPLSGYSKKIRIKFDTDFMCLETTLIF